MTLWLSHWDSWYFFCIYHVKHNTAPTVGLYWFITESPSVIFIQVGNKCLYVLTRP